ncbi:xylulokinase [Natribacillus halophilus]|uniref:Xylulokinase n=1 Tax=Natribacillus halophilus TaxID=549003 RepID=A0A1G8JW70_9BACI|nr:FGGY family carbohydrate kinase [Natribacillus halophilus]SDI35395.1 xylulokinase [Natribacillus halophilus]
MEYIATFDIGTSSIKGVLIGKDGSLQYPETRPIETDYREDGRVEQDPGQWWEKVCQITVSWWESGISPQHVKAIVMSGQMQDCIPIDADGQPVRPAILYADNRAEEQAEHIAYDIPDLSLTTGNHFDGSMIFPKIKWLQEIERHAYERTETICVSAKDYVIFQLTQETVADPVTGATTGMMDLHRKEWVTKWVEDQGLDSQKLPPLFDPSTKVGEVVEKSAKKSGFVRGTPVLCGSGDAGATTMGAGIIDQGDKYVYLGSTGWVAYVTDRITEQADGIFHLRDLSQEQYIAIAPMLNVGNAHLWAVDLFGEGEEKDYIGFEHAVQSTAPGAADVLFLPYLKGERFPIQDMSASGCFMNMRETTTKAHLSRAVLEGVSMSIRQTIETLIGEDAVDTPLILIGGGTQSESWCQILADMCQNVVRVPEHPEYLPSLGVAAAGFVYLHWSADYQGFHQHFMQHLPMKTYYPSPDVKATYERLYQKFKSLYPIIRDWSEGERFS